MRRRDFLSAVPIGLAAQGGLAMPVARTAPRGPRMPGGPPADALLGRLAKQAGVIALAWHVDYWDHLGWRDPYASRQATNRQKAYARQLDNIVFTPALVVNGARIVVGSEAEAVEAAIRAAAALTVPVSLRGTEVEIGAAPLPVRALSVIYDPEEATQVGAGENQGERLREYRIVRAVETLGEWDGSARHFTAKPAGPGQGQAILLQTADFRVIGAADHPAG